MDNRSLSIRQIKTKSVLSKSNLPVTDFAVNPYVGCTHACRYCYASFMKRFTNHSEPWGEFLDVKYWPEISNAQKYLGKNIFCSSVTDPYVPEEAVYRRTRAVLEQLQGSGAKLSIQTKSDLVLRDIDLLKSLPGVSVGFSINTLDEQFRLDMDKAVSIERRLAAMHKLHEEGIRTTTFISPIFPGISEVTSIIERVKAQCNQVWLENLNLRAGYKTVIMQYIKAKRPDLLGLYEDIYLCGNRRYWEVLDELVGRYAAENKLTYLHNDACRETDFGAPPVIVNFFYHEMIRKNCRVSGLELG